MKDLKKEVLDKVGCRKHLKMLIEKTRGEPNP